MDVGAIFRQFIHANGTVAALTACQRRAWHDLAVCRTPALGGHIERCNACGHTEYRYNSCRNRHCPQCQAGSRAAWLEQQVEHLLPVEYHHLVFTLPQELVALALANPRRIYGLLFEAASAAVQELAADPKHLGAQVGLTAVLHTWGQTLSLHPHLHVLATGGGLACNRRGQLEEPARWLSARPGFFLPVRTLSALFRGKFLAGLTQAQREGKLLLPPGWNGAVVVMRLYAQDWVVYSQPPCAGAEVVLKYLARYVHRVALSNSRLVRVDEQTVTFSYKDYRQRGKQKEMTLDRVEFVRRYLQHVLPRGFVRIRHYGLLANRGRREKLQRCRRLLLVEGLKAAPAGGVAVAAEPGKRCGQCGQGVLECIEILGRQAVQAEPEREDSS